MKYSVAYIALLLTACSFAQQFAGAKPFELVSLFGKQFEDYDAKLGKPSKIVPSSSQNMNRTSHVYEKPTKGILNISVYKRDDWSKPKYVVVIFDRKLVKNWKDGLKLLKISVDGATQIGKAPFYEVSVKNFKRYAFWWQDVNSMEENPSFNISLPD